MQSTNYIKRDITDSIKLATKYFPVITVTGPRQSGKSTLLRHIFPEVPYCSLETPDTRISAINDPKGFLDNYHDGVIIDEVQRVPEILSYIQGIVDENPDRKFYLTGSSNFALLRNVTQSLAGRTALFELLPLSLNEVSMLNNGNDLDALLYDGFYPAIWSGKNIPSMLYPNYTKTYLERDVRDLLAIKDMDAFHRFLRLCAARIGSVFNTSELSNELGIAVNTINSWLSVLQASYIVYLLPPFFTNTRKRLTKSPKLYFTDCGLASYLLNIDSPGTMNRDKMRGHLFENMVIINVLKNLYNSGQTAPIYFYRDSNGNEVDLLIKRGSKYDCVEIKSSQSFHPDFIKGLENFRKNYPELTGNQTVVYSGEDMGLHKDIRIVNYKDNETGKY